MRLEHLASLIAEGQRLGEMDPRLDPSLAAATLILFAVEQPEEQGQLRVAQRGVMAGIQRGGRPGDGGHDRTRILLRRR